MALKDEFRTSGEWLFRWRSYLPLLMLVLFLAALVDYRYLFDSRAWDRVWKLCCLAISFLGLGVRVITVGYAPAGTSGRNTRGQVAETLNTTGFYSVVRHPLYLGNFLIWLGISLTLRVWWFTLLVVLIWWLYYERIMFAEEEFLQQKFGDSFTEWASRTPAFLPKFKNWTKPALPFSFRSMIRREYSSFFAMITVFTVLEICGEIALHGKFGLDPLWLIIFGLSLVIYLAVRTIKKRTGWLHVAGR